MMFKKKGIWMLDVCFALVVLSLLYLKFVPTHTVTYVSTPASNHQFFRGPYPAGRVDASDGTFEVKGEPIYWEFYAPRHYTKAVLSITYTSNRDRVSIGFKKNDGSYTFQPLSSSQGISSTINIPFVLEKDYFHQNQLTTILSIPQIQSSDTVSVQRLSLTLSL